MNLFAPILAASPAALANTPAFTDGAAVRPTDGSPRRQTTWVRNRPAVTHAVRVDPFDYAPQQVPAEVSKDVRKLQGISQQFLQRAFPRNESGRDMLRYSTAHRGAAYFVNHNQTTDGMDDVITPAVFRTETDGVEEIEADSRPDIALTAGENRLAVISGRTRSPLDRCSAFVVGFHPAVASLNRDSNTEQTRAARSGSARVQMSFSPTATSPNTPLSGSAVFSYGEGDRTRTEAISGGRVGSFAREQLFGGSDFITADDLAILTTTAPVGVFVG